MGRGYGCCDDSDELYERYQPNYVETYLNEKTPGQSIEEWTALEGNKLFVGNQIYKPLTIAVSIQGPSNNNFGVDATRVDWHPQFVTAVKSTLVQGQIARASDTVTLTDVRGNNISDFTVHQLQQVGTIYPVVNGKRVSAAVRQQREFVDTPPTHAINKEQLLSQWSADVCTKSIEVIAAAIASSKTPQELDQRLFGEKSALKQSIQNLVESHSGHLENFAKIVEVHGDHSLLSALQQSQVSHSDIASEIAERVLDSVASAYQAHEPDVAAFFKNQEAKKRVMQTPSSSVSLDGKRSIFTAATVEQQQPVQAQVSALVDNVYPTALKLHRTILTTALSENNQLESAIGCCVCSGPSHRRRRRHPRHNNNHHHDHHQGRPSHVNGEVSAVAVTSAPSVSSSSSKGRVYTAEYRGLFGEDSSRYLKTVERCNEMARLPPAPGINLIEGHHSSSHVPGSWHVKEATYEGRHGHRHAHKHAHHSHDTANAKRSSSQTDDSDVWDKLNRLKEVDAPVAEHEPIEGWLRVVEKTQQAPPQEIATRRRRRNLSSSSSPQSIRSDISRGPPPPLEKFSAPPSSSSAVKGPPPLEKVGNSLPSAAQVVARGPPPLEKVSVKVGGGPPPLEKAPIGQALRNSEASNARRARVVASSSAASLPIGKQVRTAATTTTTTISAELATNLPSLDNLRARK